MKTVALIARVLLLAFQLLRDLTERMEREEISADAVRDYVAHLWEKHRANILAAQQIRDRTSAELERLSDDELRKHSDANFRD